MPQTIIQKVTFKNASPKEVYSLYMDSKKHSDVTKAEAKITAKEGGKMTAHKKYISGKFFQLKPGRLIVQSWRSTAFKPENVDSTLILHFEPKGKDTLMTMIHANVPDHEVKGVTPGWHEHYWEPMKEYLKNRNK
jgi:activator of HSP90 ATPase